jgi:hypothetical protein
MMFSQPLSILILITIILSSVYTSNYTVTADKTDMTISRNIITSTITQSQSKIPIVDNSTSSGSYEYKNLTLGISFSYPWNWSFDANGTGYRFFSGRDKSLTLQISLENKSLNEFTKKRMDVLNSEADKTKDFRIVDSHPSILSGNRAYQVVYALDCTFCFNSRTTELWTVVNNTSYLFRYYTEDRNLSSLQSTQEIIQSFKILKPPDWYKISLSATGNRNHRLDNLQSWSGIEFVNMTETIAKVLNLKGINGFIVTNVLPNSPAEKAGVIGGYIPLKIPDQGETVKLGGDIIVGLNNNSVKNLNKNIDMNHFDTGSNRDMLTYGYKPGDTLNLTILRYARQIKEAHLFIEKRPAFLTYENVKEGIKMVYPSNWYIPQENSVIIFSNPSTIAQNVIIDVYSNKPTQSLAEFSLKQAKLLMNRNLTDLNITSAQFSSVSGTPAYIIKYTYSCPPENCTCSTSIPACPKTTFKKIEVWIVKLNNAYTIQIDQGDPSNNLSYWLMIEEMMDSFSIINSFDSGIYTGLSK